MGMYHFFVNKHFNQNKQISNNLYPQRTFFFINDHFDQNKQISSNLYPQRTIFCFYS